MRTAARWALTVPRQCLTPIELRGRYAPASLQRDRGCDHAWLAASVGREAARRCCVRRRRFGTFERPAAERLATALVATVPHRTAPHRTATHCSPLVLLSRGSLPRGAPHYITLTLTRPPPHATPYSTPHNPTSQPTCYLLKNCSAGKKNNVAIAIP